MNNLFETTLNLLSASNLPIGEIARGSNVHTRWLYDLKNGRFSDPGVNKIQRIYNFLISNN